jgi:hypothetical protein
MLSNYQHESIVNTAFTLIFLFNWTFLLSWCVEVYTLLVYDVVHQMDRNSCSDADVAKL